MKLLQVQGNQIIEAESKPLRLRGCCIGGFLNTEDFINGYPGAESTLRGHIRNILGAAKAELFFERMADHFFTEDDISFIAKTGANCIRLPLNYRMFENDDKPFIYNENTFRRLDGILSLCEKHSLYVILDMHAAQGWQNCHWHCDNERGASLLWRHPHFQDRLAALWKAIALRYKDSVAVVGYELLNEPSTGNPNGEHPFDFYANYRPDFDRMNGLYSRLIREIREIDPKHIIFLEGDNYARKFDGLTPPEADNLVYSSHNYAAPGFGPGEYPGLFGSDAGEIYWDRNRHRLELQSQEGYRFAEKYNVPLLVGEFGSQYHGGAEQLPSRLRSMEDQLSVFDECGVHWTAWTYKDAGVMGWVTLDPESEYARIIEPVQRMKRRLGAENFVAQYSPSIGREKARELSDLILSESCTKQDADGTAYTFNYAALTGFAAAMLQPAYAKRFEHMSEADIDRVMSAFRFDRCVVNEPYIKLLQKAFSK